MFRAAAAFTTPTTLAEHDTLVGTMTEFGYCRDKSIKYECKRADAETLDDGIKHYLDYNGKLEGVGLQSAITDYSAYEAIEGVDQDFLFIDTVTSRCVFFPSLKPYFDEESEGGSVETISFLAEKEGLANKAAFRTRYDIPAS
jgi:hypothetical protein